MLCCLQILALLPEIVIVIERLYDENMNTLNTSVLDKLAERSVPFQYREMYPWDVQSFCIMIWSTLPSLLSCQMLCCSQVTILTSFCSHVYS